MFVTVSLLTFLKILGKAGDEEAKLKAQQLLKDKLKMQQKKIESLESRPLQIASEYYTAQEMVSFKKVKRRVKKVRSKGDGILKADDLIQETQEVSVSSDLGSRSRRKKTDEEPAVEGMFSLKDCSSQLTLILMYNHRFERIQDHCR